ncbi:hypothetical protein Zmor_021307 [Zophobas morio]|uniref:Laminin N-terminal domain-containing protein n=1 Tax=Zophobas morio TaxID=2755281 RepID=A0AA38I7D6_9CUCU|nr:hypothetical protein Zmor_021307 [Zophobas morio]
MFVVGARTSLWAVLVLRMIYTVQGETSLTPPYFNLAEGRKITASATCGVDTEGPELYCKLVGANAENDLNVNVIQGQFCDVCDPTRPDKMHPPEFAVDGMETWWQSPPLSRGMKYNEVNLTIDLGQVSAFLTYQFLSFTISLQLNLVRSELKYHFQESWIYKIPRSVFVRLIR